MTRPCWVIIATLAALSATTRGNETETSRTVTHEERLAGVEAELAALRQQMTASAAGGCDTHCATCCETCACCQGYWSAGAGVYYVKPHWETNPAYATTRNIGGVSSTNQSDFDYDYEIAPRAWLSYVDACGLGVRGRWWMFDGDSTATLVNNGGLAIDSAAPLGLQNLSTTAGDVVTFTSSLELDVIDLEVIQQFRCGWWSCAASFGVRYARLDQTYFHAEVPAPPVLVDAVQSAHDFEGYGPVLGFEGYCPIGCNLALYGSTRGAILFGDSQQSATQIVNNVLSNVAETSRFDVLPVSEFEIGLEWSRHCGAVRWFANAGMAAQIWLGAGNSANNEMIPVLVDPEVSDNHTNLGFFGWTFTAGVDY